MIGRINWGGKKRSSAAQALEFLDDLRFAFGEWLTEVEAEAEASEEDLAEFDAQWQKLHLAAVAQLSNSPKKSVHGVKDR